MDWSALPRLLRAIEESTGNGRLHTHRNGKGGRVRGHPDTSRHKGDNGAIPFGGRYIYLPQAHQQPKAERLHQAGASPVHFETSWMYAALPSYLFKIFKELCVHPRRE